jgi:hypothetical protein
MAAINSTLFKISESFSMTTSSMKYLKIPGKVKVAILFIKIRKIPRSKIFLCGQIMDFIIFESDT